MSSDANDRQPPERRQPGSSLRWRIARMYGVGLLLGVVGLGSVTYLRGRAIVTELAHEQLRRDVEAAGTRIEQDVAELVQRLNVIGLGRGDRERELATLIETDAAVRSLTLITPGSPRALLWRRDPETGTYTQQVAPPPEESERLVAQLALRADPTAPMLRTRTGAKEGEEPALLVKQATADGALIVAEVDPDRLLELVRALFPSLDLHLLPSGPPSAQLSGVRLEVATVSFGDGTGDWGLTASTRSRPADGAVAQLRRDVLLAGSLVALLLALLAFVTAGRLTRPLKNLTRYADDLSRGQFPERELTIEGTGEVCTLSRSFIHMADHLREMIHDLSRSQEMTRKVLDSAADALVVLDHSGAVTSVNEAAVDLFGWAESDLVGRSVAVLDAASNSPHGFSRIALSGETDRFDRREGFFGLTRTGANVPIRVRVRRADGSAGGPDKGDDGFAIVLTIQDMTQVQRAQSERARLLLSIRQAARQIAAATRTILGFTSEQADRAREQAEVVSRTGENIREISEKASEAVRASEAVVELSARADSLGTWGQDIFAEAVAAVDEVRRQVESSARQMLLLATQSKKIETIVATVTRLAEQTNVLAMNAAVEASRAGEQVEGFAVVATEIRSLAEESKRSTRQIRGLLDEIQEATASAVLKSEDGQRATGQAGEIVRRAGQTMASLHESIVRAALAATRIQVATQAQAEGIQGAVEVIDGVDGTMQQDAVSLASIESAVRDLGALSDRLEEMTREQLGGISPESDSGSIDESPIARLKDDLTADSPA